MAWTTPRTWVASEVVTAAVMNTHVRDNDAYLKAVLDGTASQAVHLLSTLEVDGLATFNGNLETLGQIIANDTVTVNAAVTVTPSGGASSGVNSSGDLYTEAGDLDIAGDAVIAGALTVAGQTIRSAGARVYNTAVQSIANATQTMIAFDSERHDTHGFHSTSLNTTRLTIPAGMGGTYLVTGHLGWAGHVTGRREAFVRVNGTTIIADTTVLTPDSGAFAMPPVVTVYQLAAGDYLELGVNQTSGGALNTLVNAAFVTEFAIAAL